MEKMTITRALAELKLLDSRITDKINASSFTTALQSGQKIFGRLTIEEFKSQSAAALQSVLDLIARRDVIKKAIVLSNAKTSVKIGSGEMTVAEAIERKASIKYEKLLLSQLTRQLKSAEVEITRGNDTANNKALEAINNAFGKETIKNPDSDVYKSIYDSTYNRLKFELVDAISIGQLIQELAESIQDFESNIDFELSTSNATTFIEV